MKALTLVNNDGRVPSIFFPAGKLTDGGTCQFASKVCLERCPSDLRTNALEQWVYKEFKTHPADELANRIHMELLDRNKLFLQWFAWGDCPARLTEKVAWIIERLEENGVTQCGFTRNKPLWEKLRIKSIANLGLTVEDEAKVAELCHYGLVGCPDYETGMVHLYRGTERVKTGIIKKRGAYLGGCGGVWHEDHEYETAVVETRPRHVHEASCDLCAKTSRGCFRNGQAKETRKPCQNT